MTVVVVDTNILSGSPRLRDQAWLTLLDRREAWSIDVVVPEIVVMETVNVVCRQWREDITALEKLRVGPLDLTEQRQAMIGEISRQIDEYEQWLTDHLDRIGVPVIPTPAASLLELARRASARRAPFRGEADGFRDTLIWLTVLDIAATRPGEPVWFLSDNFKDFGHARHGKQPGLSPDNEFPYPLHAQLIADLTDRDIQDQVGYVVRPARLVRHFESQFSPIVGTEFDQLTDALDLTVLAKQLSDTVTGEWVDPERAALEVNCIIAFVVGAQPPSGGWRFSDGARRGDEGWKARFTVTTEVDMFVHIELAEETKTLQIAGDVAVGHDGTIQWIDITGIDALPDDPMRARWQRRADRLDPGPDEAHQPRVNGVSQPFSVALQKIQEIQEAQADRNRQLAAAVIESMATFPDLPRSAVDTVLANVAALQDNWANLGEIYSKTITTVLETYVQSQRPMAGIGSLAADHDSDDT